MPEQAPVSPHVEDSQVWFGLLDAEFVERLAALSTPQQHAIRAIIQAGHYSDIPPAPTALIRKPNEDKPNAICNAADWWGNPRLGKNGKWRRIPWTRQPEFMAVLSLAKRRALALLDAVDKENARQTISIAAAASPLAMRVMAGLSAQPDDPKHAIAAATLVFKYAGLDARREDDPDNAPTLQINWWSAAEDD